MKFFSNFPDGLSGAVLLLLRATISIATFTYGAINLINDVNSTIWSRTIGLISIVCGVMILIGFLTPLVGFLICLGGIVIAISKFSAGNNFYAYNFSVLYVCVMAIALAALGAGAFSIDARLFGRREIILPDDSVMSDS